MLADGKKRPVQPGLFGSSLACTEVTNLPLIVDNKPGMVEVVAPGSVYQPLLLSPEDDRIDVGPGKLDANEARFVRDLIQWLYPDKDTYPKCPKTSLKWGDREIWF